MGHAKNNGVFWFQITRASIDALKNWFRDEMQKSDWQLIMELKKTFEIIWRSRSSKSDRDGHSRPPSDREAATEGQKKKKKESKQEEVFFCEKRSVFPTVVNSDSLDTFLSLTPTHSVFQRACSSASTLSFFFFFFFFFSWFLLWFVDAAFRLRPLPPHRKRRQTPKKELRFSVWSL